MVKHMFLACLTIVIWQFLACEGVEDLINANKAPELDPRGIIVSADRVAPFDTITASITATNPVEGPLSYEWSANGGQFIKPADSSTVQWIAPLTGGSYRITVQVSNEKKSAETSKDIEVLSSAKPLVDILDPQKDAYFVLNQPIAVRATAQHENGISWVQLIVSKSGTDSVVQRLGSNSSGSYYFDKLTAYDALVGKATLIVEAEAAQVKTLGYDTVTINVEGIIEGKNQQ